ncbi:uncharacterized protein (TIGR02646 family) [Paraburkholderia sp. GAS41]|uniref:AAA family ATPase n=1 Tax=Paraburkholderia sp. GAS41 TaxID=3035134 RepID=UPI003D243FE3
MILVKRNEVPPVFVELEKRFLPEAERFYAIPLAERGQKQFDIKFASRNSQQAFMPALFDQFAGKCAYCESTLGASTKGHVDWFRPVTGVSGSSGKYLRDHYWRQAFEWENAYLACAECWRNKTNRFPLLDESTRAQASALRSELTRETPSLLDPCLDDPSEHLLFSRDGAVAGTTERGRVTIEVFGLNRPGLKVDRQRTLNHFEHATERHRVEMLRAGQPYLAAVRQISRRIAGSAPGEDARLQTAIELQQRFDTDKERASTAPEGNLDEWDSRKRVIESITIENVGTVESLQLDLLAKNTKRTPCFALLGINGAGKSTILKAIAIALGGRPYARRLKLKSNDLLAGNAASGRVAIRISGFEEEVVLTLKRC